MDQQLGINYPKLITCSISLLFIIPAIFIAYRLGSAIAFKRLQTTFHRLFFACMIADLVYVLVQMFFLRMCGMGVFDFYTNFSTGIIPTLGYFLLQYSNNVQVAGCVMIAFNRTTSVAFPYRYEKMWRRYLWMSILVMYGIPFLLTAQLLFNEADYVQYGRATYIFHSGYADVAPYSIQIHTYILFACFVEFLLNIYTGIKLYLHIRKYNLVHQKSEVPFFLISVISLVCLLMVNVWLYLVKFGSGDLLLLARVMLPVFCDINCLCPIYVLIIISKETRDSILGIGTTTTTTTSTPTTRIVKQSITAISFKIF